MQRGWASSPIGFVRRVSVAAYEDNIPFLASALTFEALLAAVPFLVLMLAALGYFVHAGDDAVADVLNLMGLLVPSAGEIQSDPYREAERLLKLIAATRSQLSVYGIPLFLWFSTRFFGATRAALNDVFDTPESRSWIVGKQIDLLLVIASLILIVLNAMLTLSIVDKPWLGRFFTSVSTFGLSMVVFFIVYITAPTRRMRWDTAIVGSLVASLGFEVSKRLYAIYLTEFATLDRLVSNTNIIAILLLVVWMYYTAFVFLVGAEVGETYDMRRRQREQKAILT